MALTWAVRPPLKLLGLSQLNILALATVYVEAAEALNFLEKSDVYVSRG